MIVWTFVVTGSGEFSIFIPNNPAFHYQGPMAVWKFFGTETQMSELKTYLEKTFQVKVETHTSFDLVGSKEVRFFPTPRCPLCIFFDLEMDTMCGLADWEISKLSAVFEQERAKSDFQKCPLKKNHTS